MTQLFLPAWSMIAELCSTVADSLLFSRVNKLSGHDGLKLFIDHVWDVLLVMPTGIQKKN